MNINKVQNHIHFINCENRLPQRFRGKVRKTIRETTFTVNSKKQENPGRYDE